MTTLILKDGEKLPDVTTGKFHIIWKHNDIIVSEQYYNNGLLDRKNGPAVIDYYRITGNISSKTYYKNGKKHNTDSPAEIEYYDDGRVRSEGYYKNGIRHRKDGPAEIDYDNDGSIKYTHTYICGTKIYTTLYLKEYEQAPDFMVGNTYIVWKDGDRIVKESYYKEYKSITCDLSL